MEAGAKRKSRWGRDEDSVEFSRVVAFSDGVFAIAITLLVLQIHIPDQLPAGEHVGNALLDQQGDLVAYAISFAVIARLWLVHHRFFGDVTHFDPRLMALNLVYLGFVVLIPFTSEVLGDHGDTKAGVIVYAANLAIINLISAAMFLYAAHGGLTRERFMRYVERPARLRNVTGAVVFALTIPVALWSPLVAVTIWVALFFLPIAGRRR